MKLEKVWPFITLYECVIVIFLSKKKRFIVIVCTTLLKVRQSYISLVGHSSLSTDVIFKTFLTK